MRNKSSIRTITSVILLLLFSFSISSKQYWHDLFAQHEDIEYSVDQTTSVRQAGFDCDCDDLVVGTPFIEWTPSVDIQSRTEVAIAPTATYSSLLLTNHQTKDSRGPPAIG